MVYQFQKTLVVATVIGVFNIFSEGNASAAAFNFTQGGWSQGGIVTGSFEGEDLDGDRLITETEVTNFSLAWSGNGEVPALEFTDVNTWQFSLEQTQLISGFTSKATSVWSYGDRQGSIGIGAFAGTIGDTTYEAPVFKLVGVEAVPEPATVVTSLIASCVVLLKKRFLVKKHS